MTIFKLPDLGEGLAEAEIHKWHIKEGDHVTVDQIIVSVETAKAIVEVPAHQSGKIIKLYAKAGDVVETGAPLLEYESDVSSKKDKSQTVAGEIKADSNIIKTQAKLLEDLNKNSRISYKASPAVKSLAKELGVDLSQVVATGANNTITRQDVEKTIEVADRFEIIQGVRRQMAQIMTQSHQQVVPVTIGEDFILPLNTKKSDLTVLMIKAIEYACKQEPSLNAWLKTAPDGKLMRQLHTEVNLGIAVDNIEQGLFVPVIKQIENLDLNQLRDKINSLKEQIADRSLTPEDFTGAGLILSNFGALVGRYATPIVVPPMVTIVGMGRVREICVPDENNHITVKLLLPVVLTVDHRAVTGGEAARFLQAMMQNIYAST